MKPASGRREPAGELRDPIGMGCDGVSIVFAPEPGDRRPPFAGVLLTVHSQRRERSMAYDEIAAARIRVMLKNRKRVTERRMFGGLAFLLRGNMCCGLLGSDLMLRLGPEQAAAALRAPYVREMNFTGKSMKSMVFVAPAGYASDADLRDWLDRVVAFVGKLPAQTVSRQGAKPPRRAKTKGSESSE